MSAITVRPARPEDADDMAVLIDYAGEGLPVHLWAQMAEAGETAMDVGRRRARRDEGSFSWRNALMAELDGNVAGMLTGYVVGDPVEIGPDMPALFVPLTELENLAPQTWYVNVLACHPQYRNRGVGSRLLAEAERIATDNKLSDLSVIVFDANPGARRLYERHGYVQRASRPLVTGDWQTENRQAILLIKQRA